MNKDIRNYNNKGQYHGYYELYFRNKLSYRLNYKNDNEIGYEELHVRKKTYFHIK